MLPTGTNDGPLQSSRENAPGPLPSPVGDPCWAATIHLGHLLPIVAVVQHRHLVIHPIPVQVEVHSVSRSRLVMSASWFSASRPSLAARSRKRQLNHPKTRRPRRSRRLPRPKNPKSPRARGKHSASNSRKTRSSTRNRPRPSPRSSRAGSGPDAKTGKHFRL